MPLSGNAALDEVFGIVNTVVQASAALVGYVPEIRWPGNAQPDPPTNTKIWLRVSTRNVIDSQRSLSNSGGKRRFESHNLLYVQLFAPRSAVGALDIGRQLAQTIRSQFRKPSPTGEVWFRNQRVVELAEETDCYPVNVVVEYLYDTVE